MQSWLFISCFIFNLTYSGHCTKTESSIDHDIAFNLKQVSVIDFFFLILNSTLMTLHYTKVTYKRLLTKGYLQKVSYKKVTYRRLLTEGYLQKVTYRRLLTGGYLQNVTYMSILKSVT